MIQTALVSVGYPGPLEKVYLHVNMYTTPAFIAALLAIANFLLLIIMFRLHTVSDTGPINSAVNYNDDDDEEEEEVEGWLCVCVCVCERQTRASLMLYTWAVERERKEMCMSVCPDCVWLS